MPTEPLVSVILPAYNRRDMLPQAIRSVLDQSLSDLELIVVDDGSTDDTKGLAELAADRVRYSWTPHGGAAHARNVGLRSARGRYLAFLDSDDLYEPGKLAVQVEFLKSNPWLEVVSTEASAVSDDGTVAPSHLRSMHGLYERNRWSYGDVFERSGEFRTQAFPRPIPYHEGPLFARMLLGPLLLSPTVLFTRRVLETVGLQDESYRLGEDYEYLVRIARTYRIAFLDAPLYVVRYHRGQVSRARRPHTLETIRAEIEIEQAFLQTVVRWGLGDPEFYRANRGWLDHRIAELHLCIGEKWLECGEGARARGSFRAGLEQEPGWQANRRALWLARFPSLARRALKRLARARVS